MDDHWISFLYLKVNDGGPSLVAWSSGFVVPSSLPSIGRRSVPRDSHPGFISAVGLF